MPSKISAGLLMFRVRNRQLEVFIAHPGGPFFRYRDYDAWSIPKGEVNADEGLLEAAVREFKEEVGLEPRGPYVELGSVRQKSGKQVYAWAFLGDCDETQPIKSNNFELEWPPGTGRKRSFPEVDRAGFFSLDPARRRLKVAQHAFLDRLASGLREAGKIDC